MLSAINRARRTRRDESGFTLIELLIVIVILGVLAAIVVFSVQGITDRGKTSACKTSVSTIDTAYEAFIANGGTGAATAVTVSSLAPNFLHSVPATVGGTTITGTTKVSDVDAIVC